MLPLRSGMGARCCGAKENWASASCGCDAGDDGCTQGLCDCGVKGNAGDASANGFSCVRCGCLDGYAQD